MSLELKTTDTAGAAVGSVTLDPEAFGGKIKNRLLHAAAVMYHNNQRQGSHCTKTRAEISGSTHKLFRQKGTGRARAGNRKSGVRKGGGTIHGPKPRNYVYHMPQKQRQAALRNAVFGKAKDGELKIVKDLDLAEPKTKGAAAFFKAQELDFEGETILVATDGLKRNVYLATRNMPGIHTVPAQELNARDVLIYKHLVIDQAAFERLNSKPERVVRERKPKGSRKKKEEA
jgi:large subunit ribosomal protein L4